MWRTVAVRGLRFTAHAGIVHGGYHLPSSHICTSRPWRRSVSSNMSAEGDSVQGGSQTPSGFVEITEGRAKILFPSSNEVFYNPVQEVNRDLSTLVINHFTKKVWVSNRKKRKRKELSKSGAVGESGQEPEREEAVRVAADKYEGEPTTSSDTGEDAMVCEGDNMKENVSKDKPHQATEEGEVTVLEALAASGLRSIRYALEVPAVSRVVANDFSSDAYESMCRNIAHNSVQGRVVPSCREASMLMYEHKDPLKQFTVIDLDPYGSPSVFLDSAVQAISEGGLLCITCTDASVLCGNNPETCYSKAAQESETECERSKRSKVQDENS